MFWDSLTDNFVIKHISLSLRSSDFFRPAFVLYFESIILNSSKFIQIVAAEISAAIPIPFLIKPSDTTCWHSSTP